jgi:adenosylhomocysteine nucleosidase
LIGIIGAMQEEIALFLEEMERETTEKVAGIEYHVGTLAGVQVVLCQSGVGKVNAAVCTQAMIDRFQVDSVVFTGVAGAVDPALDIGDIVISESCQQHDMDVTALGLPKGQIPFQEVSIFEADPVWMQAAEEAAREVTEGKVITGKVISGDQFIASPSMVTLLREEFKAACVEMEGAAVAQVCHMNEIPFVVIRSMSDRADHSANINFAEFAQTAARRSNEMVKRMIQKRLG